MTYVSFYPVKGKIFLSVNYFPSILFSKNIQETLIIIISSYSG